MNDSNLIIYEHQIIEVQFEIDKFMAELEFHKQKSRLITDQLELNNTKLSHLQKIIQRRRKLNKFRSKKHD
jgi:5-bromo-4-chloroindolyl phosphate hydrolysis protein